MKKWQGEEEAKKTGKERKRKEKKDVPSKEVQKAACNPEKKKEMGEEEEKMADTPRDKVARGPDACCNGCINKFSNEQMHMIKTTTDEWRVSLYKELKEIAREVKQASSTSSAHDSLFSVNDIIHQLSSSKSWVLTSLSHTENEELQCKQRQQQAVEGKAAIKRLGLMQEELHMIMGKLHSPGNEKT